MKPIAFMRGRFVAAAFSGVLLLATVISLAVQQLNWGLDFTGGTLIELNYEDGAWPGREGWGRRGACRGAGP